MTKKVWRLQRPQISDTTLDTMDNKVVPVETGPMLALELFPKTVL